MYQDRLQALLQEAGLSGELQQQLEDLCYDIAQGSQHHDRTSRTFLENPVLLREDPVEKELLSHSEAPETYNLPASTLPPQGSVSQSAGTLLQDMQSSGSLGRYEDLGLLGI